MAELSALSWDERAEEVARMRQRLVTFFSVNARAQDADDLANVTITRVLQRLQAGEAVSKLGAFTVGVARRVLLENYRRLRKERETTTSLDDLVAEGREPRDQSATGGEKPLNDVDVAPDAHHCIAKCLQELSLDQRDLLVRYFADGKNKHNRAALAGYLGISRGAL